MGGQDCKGIRVDDRGKVTDFVMSDKCAAGAGRFLEIIADLLNLTLDQIGEVSLTAKEKIPFNPNMCGVKAKSEILFLKQAGVPKADILSGLHDVVSLRVISMLNRIGIEDKFVMTGGPAKNIGLVSKIEKMAGLKIHIPSEPMIAGALGAALYATEKAAGTTANQKLNAYS
jgi:predicted CoA-substrate-specific enzyme activase